MLSWSVRVYIWKTYYNVELRRNGKVVYDCERDTWEGASSLARVLCKEHGLQCFATYRIAEHLVRLDK